jgi:hypothetical protein
MRQIPLTTGDTISVIVDPDTEVSERTAGQTVSKATALQKAFLQFRMENAATTITISRIKVEYIP